MIWGLITLHHDKNVYSIRGYIYISMKDYKFNIFLWFLIEYDSK